MFMFFLYKETKTIHSLVLWINVLFFFYMRMFLPYFDIIIDMLAIGKCIFSCQIQWGMLQ